MPRGLASSTFMKPFVVLALPGMYLFYKYSQYREQQQEQNRRKVTERELAHLNHKIDKLLTKLEENEPELATSQEDECVICVNAKATMQTSPCGHRVVCRKCFVKTIQMAVSQRLLPLRCVICRAKILRLKQSGGGGGGVLLPHCNAKGWGLQSSTSGYAVGNGKWLLPGSASSYSMGKNWVPNSASQYSMGNDGNVPNSESLYSMSSGSSSFSGVSSVSSATTSSQGSSTSKTGKCSGARLGYPRQPTGCLKKSQTQAMKLRIQDYKEPMRAACIREPGEKPARLPPIAEFQREYRASKERTGSASTRIRCAQKIVTQLEITPLLKPPSSSPTPTPCSSYFRSPLKPANLDDTRKGEKRKDVIAVVKNEKDENVDNKKKEEKLSCKKIEKEETKVEKKMEKKDAKTEKKESKAEKEERKKEAKAEKKLLKLEAKAEKKKEKEKAKEAKEAAKAAEKRDKV